MNAKKNVTIVMDEAFGAATGAGDEENIEDQYMKKYVDDKLGVNKSNEDEVIVPEYVKEDEALYALPAQIKVGLRLSTIHLFI